MKRDLYRFAKARRKNREYIELNQYIIRFKYDNNNVTNKNKIIINNLNSKL